MYRIGICDDDFSFCAQIEEFLENYAKRENILIETEVFLSGEEYLKYMETEPALDLLFLDIELGRINGILVGRFIRTKLENEVTQIVYVSVKESYAIQLFKTRPLDFLVKPVLETDIDKVMSEYRRLFDGKKLFFEYQIGKAIFRTAYRDIMYFQCFGKKVQLFTNKPDVKEFYAKMADVKKQLDQICFLVIHKSYIVNIQYVSEFRFNEIELSNGTVLPISQSMRKVVQQRLLEINTERGI